MDYTESSRAYRQGFILTEPTFLRLVDQIGTEYQSAASQQPEFSFRLRFRNGAVAWISSAEEVLSLENSGSSQIEEIVVECGQRDSKAAPYISLRFSEISLHSASSSSVAFQVRGPSRHWVFSTTALLDERIKQIRRNTAVQLLHAVAWPTFSMILVTSFILAFLLSGFRNAAYMQEINFSGNKPRPSPEFPELPDSPKASTLLEAARIRGEVKDALDGLLFLEEQRESANARYEKISAKWKEENKAWRAERDAWLEETKRRNDPMVSWQLFTALTLLPVLVILLVKKFAQRYFPLYNFCWGDYAESFRRREGAGKYILGSVLLALLLSVLGSLIAEQL